MTTTSNRRPRMTDEPGVRFGIANGALVAALLVAAALPLDLPETAVVALATATLAGATIPWAFTLALGVESWAFFTGFFEHRYGVLTFAPRDLATLAGFATASVVLAHLLRGRAASLVGGRDR